MDEVICGYGRVGDWFASNRFGLEPDLVTFAKGITSGYVPLGGVIVGPRVREAFWGSSDGRRLATRVHVLGSRDGHGGRASRTSTSSSARTFSGGALELERELADALDPLAEHELVSEVRAGLGVVAAVQIDPELLAADPGLSDRAVDRVPRARRPHARARRRRITGVAAARAHAGRHSGAGRRSPRRPRRGRLSFPGDGPALGGPVTAPLPFSPESRARRSPNGPAPRRRHRVVTASNVCRATESTMPSGGAAIARPPPSGDAPRRAPRRVRGLQETDTPRHDLQ